jgi:hypothetical protein
MHTVHLVENISKTFSKKMGILQLTDRRPNGQKENTKEKIKHNGG